MGLNLVIYQGRLTKDVRFEYTPDGTPVASFNLAVQKNYKNSEGVREADFFRVVAYRGLAENFATNTRKGSHIIVTGRNTMRKYTTEDGEIRTVVELIAERYDWAGSKQTSDSRKSDAGLTSGEREIFERGKDQIVGLPPEPPEQAEYFEPEKSPF
jgi:single-strand DNA-binding protein